MSQGLPTRIKWMYKLAPFYLLTFVVFYLGLTRESVPNDAFTPLRWVMLALFVPLAVKYVIQLLAAVLYSLTQARPELSGTLPRVSVLIPAWNEEVGIVKTLRSALNSDYPDLEIVVINDGSTDGTHQQIQDFLQSLPAEHRQLFCYLKLPNGGKAKAMNCGLERASGELIVTVDADSLLDRQAVGRLVARFADPDVAAVAGNVVIGNRARSIECLQQLEYLYGFFFKRGDSVFNSVYIIGGAAAAYRRDVLQQLGGFDHSIITEDIEISTRILAHGYKTRYAHDAVVYTEGPSDWKGLCNQRLRWKFGRLQTFFRHRSLFFQCRRRPGPYLSWLLLPVALYAELLLLFEVVLMTLFFGYTIYTQDFLPLMFVILLMSSIIWLQVISDPKRATHGNLLWLAPVAWLLFFFIDAVEFQALYRSIKRFCKGEALQWQKWVRKGLSQAPELLSDSNGSQHPVDLLN
ncbi:glycosyltransferase [Pontibacter sp. JAM-7]|uniref:glycosyltransferase n=1 Tax=Pontibacter sp. JAM-7 TaxID=3366581 RepID=UPI003AF7CBDA